MLRVRPPSGPSSAVAARCAEPVAGTLPHEDSGEWDRGKCREGDVVTEMPPEPEIEPDDTGWEELLQDEAAGEPDDDPDLPFEVVNEPDFDVEPAGADRHLDEVVNDPDIDDPA